MLFVCNELHVTHAIVMSGHRKAGEAARVLVFRASPIYGVDIGAPPWPRASCLIIAKT